VQLVAEIRKKRRGRASGKFIITIMYGLRYARAHARVGPREWPLRQITEIYARVVATMRCNAAAWRYASATIEIADIIWIARGRDLR